MTQQCIFIKHDGLQCKLRTSKSVCHMHAKLYEIQMEQKRQQEEAQRINDELLKLKEYEKNVKAQIKGLIEKRTKINSLKDELELYQAEVKTLEKENEYLEKQNEELEQTQEMMKQEFLRLRKENEELKQIASDYDKVRRFEKMKLQLIELTGNQKFDINTVAVSEKYQPQLEELFGCKGNELKQLYWRLQKIRVRHCHPYRNPANNICA